MFYSYEPMYCYFLSDSKNIKDKWYGPYREEHSCTMEAQFKIAALLKIALFCKKCTATINQQLRALYYKLNLVKINLPPPPPVIIPFSAT